MNRWVHPNDGDCRSPISRSSYRSEQEKPWCAVGQKNNFYLFCFLFLDNRNFVGMIGLCPLRNACRFLLVNG